jgi:hypothetical protein
MKGLLRRRIAGLAMVNLIYSILSTQKIYSKTHAQNQKRTGAEYIYKSFSVAESRNGRESERNEAIHVREIVCI